jgi:hypothetical protein
MKACLFTATALLVLIDLAWAAHAPREGFGDTPGGSGKPVYRVTTLTDDRANPTPGSLRSAVSQGHRHIVFEVAGTIELDNADLDICQSFLTIDGFSAPPPGITLKGRGVRVWGICRGLPTNTSLVTGHDVIVQGIRVRDAGAAGTSVDCFAVANGAYNVVLDHVSAQGCADGVIDITGSNVTARGGPETRDVTVSWSVFGPSYDGKRTSLNKYGVSRLSFHHNLFVLGTSRIPDVSRQQEGADPDTTVDFRNNVVWAWGPGSGSRIYGGATANLIANLYASPNSGQNDKSQGVIFCGVLPAPADKCPGPAAAGFAAGNVSLDGFNWNGGAASPLPAAPVTTQDACTAAELALLHAGAPHDDGIDATLKANVVLTSCRSGAAVPGTPPPVSGPSPPPGAVGGNGRELQAGC